MKTNFKKDEQTTTNPDSEHETTELTEKEFEDFVSKSGAKGSFMIYRSHKKDEELGIDEL